MKNSTVLDWNHCAGTKFTQHRYKVTVWIVNVCKLHTLCGMFWRESVRLADVPSVESWMNCELRPLTCCVLVADYTQVTLNTHVLWLNRLDIRHHMIWRTHMLAWWGNVDLTKSYCKTRLHNALRTDCWHHGLVTSTFTCKLLPGDKILWIVHGDELFCACEMDSS